MIQIERVHRQGRTTSASPTTWRLLALGLPEQRLDARHNQVRLRLRDHMSAVLGDDERPIIDRIGEQLM